ncbi:unnamed protein product [Acanthoscelides obtectus]|uniref:Uncharacterized protein n=1 Tax=Acanthoscelides obtectus TaxID=200917 RepID=A0A9P0QAP1_ACAOB|nr:unnamed protein product [Acanthoscelides obtectus]
MSLLDDQSNKLLTAYVLKTTNLSYTTNAAPVSDIKSNFISKNSISSSQLYNATQNSESIDEFAPE